MTIQIGDRGQRFEVQCLGLVGETHHATVGWADDPSDLLRTIEAHPEWHTPRVIDRRPLEPPLGARQITASFVVDAMMFARYSANPEEMLRNRKRNAILAMLEKLSENMLWTVDYDAKTNTETYRTEFTVSFPKPGV